MDDAIVILAIPFIIGGILGLVIGMIEFVNIYRARNSKSYESLTGVIDLHVTTDTRYKIGIPYVKFKYKDIEYNKRVILQGDFEVKYKSGDKVIVLYQPGSDKDKVRISEESLYRKPLSVTIIGLILSGAALAVLFL